MHFEEPEVQEISKNEFLAGILQNEKDLSYIGKSTQETVARMPTSGHRLLPSCRAYGQSFDASQACNRISLKSHIALWVGIFVVVCVVVFFGDVVWEDEPARLHELRLFWESVLRDLRHWVVSFNTGDIMYQAP